MPEEPTDEYPLAIEGFDNETGLLRVKKAAEISDTVTCFVAAYSPEGILLKVNMVDEKIDCPVDEVKQVDVGTLDVPENSTFKAFIWDGLSGVRPLSENYEK